MSYSVRHQIFVSSTFTDLKEERAEVIQAIWELDCIPTGMEAFVASNESQWEVIKRVIDECDYYVLIIGGRYGSITSDGISFTEKEYRYARKIGLPILAFVQAEPEVIPLIKSEINDANRLKLQEFRDNVMKAYPIREWRSGTELGGVVSRSLIREIKISPRPGWIRNDGSSPIALLEQINKLTEENRALRESYATSNLAIDDNLSSGDDIFHLKGERRLWSDTHLSTKTESWTAATSWNEIWRDLGPILINEATEDAMLEILTDFHTKQPIPESYKLTGPKPILWTEIWSAVLIQFRALGFIVSGTKKRGVNDQNSYWKITELGDKHLVRLLAQRKLIDEFDALLG